MITKEHILQRMESLESDKEKLLSSLNATEGALLDCQYWLSQIEKEDTEKQD